MFSFSSYFNRQSFTLIGLIVILLSIPLTALLAQKTQQLRQRAAGTVTIVQDSASPCNENNSFCMWFDATTDADKVAVFAVGQSAETNVYIKVDNIGKNSNAQVLDGTSCGKADYAYCWKFLIPNSQISSSGHYGVTFGSDQADLVALGFTATVSAPTPTATPTSIPPTATPAPAAGKDVGDCKEIKIDGVPIESANHPAIVVGKDSKITMTMRNTPPGGQTGEAAPVPTTVQTTVWGSNYSLRFIGTSGNEYDLGINRTKIDTNQSVGRGNEVSFDVFINPRPLPTDKTTKEFTEFKWRMHDDKGTAFGGACSPGLTVYATAPGASPTPGAPGTCPTDSTHFCSTDVSKLPGGGGGCTRTTESFTCANDPNTGFQQSCFYCPPTTPTPTLTPTPTEVPSRCEGAGLECSLDDPTATGRRDPNQYACRDIGRLNCSSPQRCWACTIRTGPTPTSTPPPGAPTISPIPPGSTVIPIQVALQEFVPLAVPSSTQKSLIPRSKQRQINVTLAPPVGTSGPNFGPFPATVNFVSNGLFLGTVYVPPPNILPAGTNSFRVFADEPSHLQRLIATIPITTAASGGNPTADGKATPLLVGDIVHNNHIDVTDWTAAVSCLGPNKGSSSCGPYSTTADLDDDGEITIFDLNWISTNMLLCLGGSKDTFGCGGDATP